MAAPTRQSVPVKGKEKKTAVRKKPKFLRTDWHKKIRLGRGVKKNQKWHGAKGRQNKFRLGRKGRGQRPKVGWGATNDTKGFVNGLVAVRVENIKMLEGLRGVGIVVGSVGKKKRAEIIKKAGEMKLVILNRYLKDGKTPLGVPQKSELGGKNAAS